MEEPELLVDYLAMTWYPIEYLKVSGSSDLADFNSKEYAKSIIGSVAKFSDKSILV